MRQTAHARSDAPRSPGRDSPPRTGKPLRLRHPRKHRLPASLQRNAETPLGRTHRNAGPARPLALILSALNESPKNEPATTAKHRPRLESLFSHPPIPRRPSSCRHGQIWAPLTPHHAKEDPKNTTPIPHRPQRRGLTRSAAGAAGAAAAAAAAAAINFVDKSSSRKTQIKHTRITIKALTGHIEYTMDKQRRHAENTLGSLRAHSDQAEQKHRSPSDDLQSKQYTKKWSRPTTKVTPRQSTQRKHRCESAALLSRRPLRGPGARLVPRPAARPAPLRHCSERRAPRFALGFGRRGSQRRRYALARSVASTARRSLALPVSLLRRVRAGRPAPAARASPFVVPPSGARPGPSGLPLSAQTSPPGSGLPPSLAEDSVFLRPAARPRPPCLSVPSCALPLRPSSPPPSAAAGGRVRAFRGRPARPARSRSVASPVTHIANPRLPTRQRRARPPEPRSFRARSVRGSAPPSFGLAPSARPRAAPVGHPRSWRAFRPARSPVRPSCSRPVGAPGAARRSGRAAPPLRGDARAAGAGRPGRSRRCFFHPSPLSAAPRRHPWRTIPRPPAAAMTSRPRSAPRIVSAPKVSADAEIAPV